MSVLPAGGLQAEPLTLDLSLDFVGNLRILALPWQAGTAGHARLAAILTVFEKNRFIELGACAVGGLQITTQGSRGSLVDLDECMAPKDAGPRRHRDSPTPRHTATR